MLTYINECLRRGGLQGLSIEGGEGKRKTGVGKEPIPRKFS